MRISLDLELADKPGELVNVLEPISDHSGNVVSIIHDRDVTTGSGGVMIYLTIDFKGSLDPLLSDLRERGIKVVSAGELRLRESCSVVIVGHVVHTDLRDTIDRIDSTGHSEVVDMALKMPGVNDTSSARITINSTGSEQLSESLEILRSIAREKDLLLIEPLETGER